MSSAVIEADRGSRPAEKPDVLFEIVNGQRQEVPPMGMFAGLVASALQVFLWNFATPRKLGRPAVEVLFRLGPNGPSRRPDVAFVATDRLGTQFESPDDPQHWETVPNLAVEIISPTNTFKEIEDKLDDYFRAGVQLAWVISPARRRIYVYESPTQVRVLSENDELSGDPAVPGFKLPVRELFAVLAAP